ncbi:MAG: hypothetical protein K2J25_02105 [Oscillospiraceae bacterium]|nr:hypothetical protein [Oscillospiraceae bacterium]
MNEKLKALFEQWNTKHDGTPEYDHAWKILCDDGEDERGKYFLDCVFAESEQAFAAGFQTAVQLLIGGVQS